MSRAFNLAMTEDEIVKHCRTRRISISVVETLPGGGVRLVCSSAGGADQIRTRLRQRIIRGEVARERFRPRTPLW